MRRALARKSMTVFATVMTIAGVAVGGVGAILAVDHYGDGWGDVGKALMSLAVALLVTGGASVAVKVLEQSRSDREGWGELLKKLVEAEETVEVAGILINAHRSALTYSQQHAKVLATKLALRQVALDPLVVTAKDSKLTDCLNQMLWALFDLGEEYREKYLDISEKQ